MAVKTHIYQQLGQAPYSLIGYEYDPRIETALGWQGGTHACDHCGRGIVHVFFIRSADGKEFTLGSEHATYLGDDGLVANVKARMAEFRRESREEADRAWRQAEADKQAENRAKVIAERKDKFAKILPILKGDPHPNSYFAGQGKTMLDYLEYFRANISKSIAEQEDDWWWYNSKVNAVLEKY